MNILKEKNKSSEECVLNTSSLSSFVITNCFDIVRLFFKRIYIPSAVRQEFSREFPVPNGIITRTLSSHQKKRANAIGMGGGENESIILAQDLQRPLIIDDTPPRELAKKIGLTVWGSLGLIRFAYIICELDRTNYESRIKEFEILKRAKPELIAWAFQATK